MKKPFQKFFSYELFKIHLLENYWENGSTLEGFWDADVQTKTEFGSKLFFYSDSATFI